MPAILNPAPVLHWFCTYLLNFWFVHSAGLVEVGILCVNLIPWSVHGATRRSLEHVFGLNRDECCWQLKVCVWDPHYQYQFNFEWLSWRQVQLWWTLASRHEAGFEWASAQNNVMLLVWHHKLVDANNESNSLLVHIQSVSTARSQTTMQEWEGDIYMFDAVQSQWLQMVCRVETNCHVVQQLDLCKHLWSIPARWWNLWWAGCQLMLMCFFCACLCKFASSFVCHWNTVQGLLVEEISLLFFAAADDCLMNAAWPTSCSLWRI